MLLKYFYHVCFISHYSLAGMVYRALCGKKFSHIQFKPVLFGLPDLKHRSCRVVYTTDACIKL